MTRTCGRVSHRRQRPPPPIIAALALEPGALDLHEVVTECLGLVRQLAATRGVRLHAASQVLRGVLVAADRRRFKQVLLNLLGNAIKYNRIDGDVTVELRREEGMLWLAVRDGGHGLSAEEQARQEQPALVLLDTVRRTLSGS